MNLVEPKTWPAGNNKLAAAILLPNEKAPASREQMYEIETDDILRHAIDYMEDHWLKQTVEGAHQNPNIRKEMADYYAKIVKTILAMPEDQCGPQAK